MNATTETAARGFEIYQSLKNPTLAKVNAKLTKEKREPIHLRSFTHYGDLVRAGLDEYMPINQFFVRNSMGEFD